jgi:hypothetical protein
LPRRYQQPQRVIITEAERAPIDAKDAGRSAANQLDESAGSQAQLMEPADMSGRANDFANFGGVAGAKRGERNKLAHSKSRESVENDSQYYLSADSTEMLERIQQPARRMAAPDGKFCRRGA